MTTVITTTAITPAPTTSTPTAPPPAGTPPPAVLVGDWSASTAESGPLELSIDSAGRFHHYNGRQMDDRGTVSVQGSKITFQVSGGRSYTMDWSVTGGTLTLAGITYLKSSPGAGGELALAGEWIGIDDVFETLVFTADGAFTHKHELVGTTNGTFQVQGNKVTVSLPGRPPATFTWSIDNGKLTLVDSGGKATQYARLS